MNGIESKGCNQMKELILLKNNDVFTASLVIAEGTGNQHNNFRKAVLCILIYVPTTTRNGVTKNSISIDRLNIEGVI